MTSRIHNPSTSTPTPAPPSPNTILFARGVIARLSIWPILRIAIQEGWGGSASSNDGRSKCSWIASEIVDAFESHTNSVSIDKAHVNQSSPDDQYIEELLLQIMQDEFDTDVEDGSAENVGVDIVRLWEETRVGCEGLVLKFEEEAERLRGRKVQVQTQVVDEDTDENVIGIEDGDVDGEWLEEEEEDDEREGMNITEEGLEGQSAPAATAAISQTPTTPISMSKKKPEVDEDGFILVKRGRGQIR